MLIMFILWNLKRRFVLLKMLSDRIDILVFPHQTRIHQNAIPYILLCFSPLCVISINHHNNPLYRITLQAILTEQTDHTGNQKKHKYSNGFAVLLVIVIFEVKYGVVCAR